jgi:hypothetical protein
MEDLQYGEAERVSAHEAGHIVVALSLGVAVDKVRKVEGAELPKILRLEGFDSSVATDFSESVHGIEPRRQFLITVGGMAAETLLLGSYHKGGAAHDLDSLRPNVLNETQIKGLVEVAQLMLLPNLFVLRYVREQLFRWLNNSSAAPLSGDPFNRRFFEKGCKVQIAEHLDRVLQP